MNYKPIVKGLHVRSRKAGTLILLAVVACGPAMSDNSAVAAPVIDATSPIGYRIVDGVVDMTEPLDGSSLTEDTGLTVNVFQNGRIHWSSTTGARWVHGALLAKWAGFNYENGQYGYPTSEEYSYDGAYTQDFKNGKLYWGQADPICTTRVDFAHGSFHEPGRTNVESNVQCNKVVATISIVTKLLEPAANGYFWVRAENPQVKANKAFFDGQAAWNECHVGRIMRGSLSATIIGVTGVTINLPLKQGADNAVKNCEGKPHAP